jgi:hypothetical protein
MNQLWLVHNQQQTIGNFFVEILIRETKIDYACYLLHRTYIEVLKLIFLHHRFQPE